MRVSVIIPTFNRARFLENTLICLTNQNLSSSDYEIIIVDSGNDKETVKLIKQLKSKHKNIIYKRIPKNSNRALLRKIGAKMAHYEILLFLDNDILVDPFFIRKHLGQHKPGINRVVMGYRYLIGGLDFFKIPYLKTILKKYFYKIKELPASLDERYHIYGNMSTDKLHFWRYCYSHNLSLPKKLFNEIGGFNKIFGRNWGVEDVELGLRLYLKKAEFILDSDIETFHQPHESSGHINYINNGIFMILYPFFEIELFNHFWRSFRRCFNEIKKIQEEEQKEHNGKPYKKEKGEIVLGCFHSVELLNRKDFNLKSIENEYLGIELPHILDKSVKKVRIKNTIFLMEYRMQILILKESSRIAQNKIIIEFRNIENYITEMNQIEKLLGYLEYDFSKDIDLEEKEIIIYLEKYKRPRIIWFWYPPIFLTRIHYQFLSLAYSLMKNGYLIIFNDFWCPNSETSERKLPKPMIRELNNCFHNYEFYMQGYHFLPESVVDSEEYVYEMGTYSHVLVWNHLGQNFLDDLEIIYDKRTNLFRNDKAANKLQRKYSNQKILPFTTGFNPDFFYPNSNHIKQNKEFCFGIFANSGFYQDGIDLALEAFQEEFAREEKVKLIIYIHQIEPIQNTALKHHSNNKLIEISLNSYIEKYNTNLFRIMNSINNRPELNSQVQIQIQDTPIEEYSKIYWNMDCLISATRFQIIETETLEAMACGIKVIVPEHTLTDDILSHCEAIYEVKTKIEPIYEALRIEISTPTASMLVQTMEKESLRRMLRKAFEDRQIQPEIQKENQLFLANNYSWDHKAEELAKHLEEFQYQ